MSKHTEGPWTLMSVTTTRDVGEHDLLIDRTGLELVLMKKPEDIDPKLPGVSQQDYDKIIWIMKQAPEMLELLRKMEWDGRVMRQCGIQKNGLPLFEFGCPFCENMESNEKGHMNEPQFICPYHKDNWLGKLLKEN